MASSKPAPIRDAGVVPWAGSMNNRQLRIAVIKGDGIGVDVTDATLAVIGAVERRVGERTSHAIQACPCTRLRQG